MAILNITPDFHPVPIVSPKPLEFLLQYGSGTSKQSGLPSTPNKSKSNTPKDKLYMQDLTMKMEEQHIENWYMSKADELISEVAEQKGKIDPLSYMKSPQFIKKLYALQNEYSQRKDMLSAYEGLHKANYETYRDVNKKVSDQQLSPDAIMYDSEGHPMMTLSQWSAKANLIPFDEQLEPFKAPAYDDFYKAYEDSFKNIGSDAINSWKETILLPDGNLSDRLQMVGDNTGLLKIGKLKTGIPESGYLNQRQVMDAFNHFMDRIGTDPNLLQVYKIKKNQYEEAGGYPIYNNKKEQVGTMPFEEYFLDKMTSQKLSTFDFRQYTEDLVKIDVPKGTTSFSGIVNDWMNITRPRSQAKIQYYVDKDESGKRILAKNDIMTSYQALNTFPRIGSQFLKDWNNYNFEINDKGPVHEMTPETYPYYFTDGGQMLKTSDLFAYGHEKAPIVVGVDGVITEFLDPVKIHDFIKTFRNTDVNVTSSEGVIDKKYLNMVDEIYRELVNTRGYPSDEVRKMFVTPAMGIDVLFDTEDISGTKYSSQADTYLQSVIVPQDDPDVKGRIPFKTGEKYEDLSDVMHQRTAVPFRMPWFGTQLLADGVENEKYGNATKEHFRNDKSIKSSIYVPLEDLGILENLPFADDVAKSILSTNAAQQNQLQQSTDAVFGTAKVK